MTSFISRVLVLVAVVFVGLSTNGIAEDAVRPPRHVDPLSGKPQLKYEPIEGGPKLDIKPLARYRSFGGTPKQNFVFIIDGKATIGMTIAAVSDDELRRIGIGINPKDEERAAGTYDFDVTAHNAESTDWVWLFSPRPELVPIGGTFDWARTKVLTGDATFSYTKKFEERGNHMHVRLVLSTPLAPIRLFGVGGKHEVTAIYGAEPPARQPPPPTDPLLKELEALFLFDAKPQPKNQPPEPLFPDWFGPNMKAAKISRKTILEASPYNSDSVDTAITKILWQETIFAATTTRSFEQYFREMGLSNEGAAVLLPLLEKGLAQRGELTELLNFPAASKQLADKDKRAKFLAVIAEKHRESEAAIAVACTEQLSRDDRDALTGALLRQGLLHWTHPLCVDSMEFSPEQVKRLREFQSKHRGLLDAEPGKTDETLPAPCVAKLMDNQRRAISVLEQPQLHRFFRIQGHVKAGVTVAEFVATMEPILQEKWHDAVPLIRQGDRRDNAE